MIQEILPILSLISRGGGNSGGGGGQPIPDFTEQNQLIFNELYMEKGLGKQGKEKLQEILDFCNENNLELQRGKNFGTDTYPGVTAKVSIIDHETGKTINIFNDLIKGTHAEDLDYDTLNNVLHALRNVKENTKPEFFNQVTDIQLSNRTQIDETGDGKGKINHSLGFFDHRIPRAISINSETFAHKHDVRSPRPNSYQYYLGEKSMNAVADVIAHEMGHAYDFNVIGKGQGLGHESVFAKYGKWTDNRIGPTEYATTTPDETISTTIEQVYGHRLRGDAYMRDGTWVPETSSTGKELSESERYNIWAKEWPELVTEAERIIRR